VRVQRLGGAAVLSRDGLPWFGWAAERPYVKGNYAIYERLARHGVTEQCHVDATCSEDIYHPELRFWVGPDELDGSAQARNFARCLQAAPDSLLQLRIYVGAPPWWTEANPAELQRYDDGSTRRSVQRSDATSFPSLASERWRHDACEALDRYIDWLLESGWSRRVSSLFIGYGITWEWALLGSDTCLDYSEPAQRYFVSWLRRRYGDDPDQLSAAWGRRLDFEEAEIPSAQRRSRPGGPHGRRQFPAEQDVVDHQLSLSDMNADLLIALAERARARCPVPIGCFYGYTLTARDQRPFMGLYGAGGFRGGHHALGRVLRCDAVDFLASPFNYCDRTLEQGVLLEHVPLASVAAHGKAFFDEVDLWSHDNPPNSETTGEMSVGVAQDLADSLALYRRSFSQAIVRAKHQWLTELTGWWGPERENFVDPVLLDALASMAGHARSLVAVDRSPVAEIAFVLDEESVAMLTFDNDDFREHIYRASVGWHRLGTPVDLVLLSDLLDGNAGPYRLVVPAIVEQPGAIAALAKWREQAPQTDVIWNGEPGWLPPPAPEIAAASARAGVHRYVDRAVTVWANSSMVAVHWPKEGHAGASEVAVRFTGPWAGTELFSERPFAAGPDGTLPWTFASRDVALFVRDGAARQPRGGGTSARTVATTQRAGERTSEETT
jgi:hypothetical protein